MKGKVFSINISKTKGVAKIPVSEAFLIKDFGFQGDIHAAPGGRQVSLLALESIKCQNECPKVKKTGEALNPGDFAENITTEGLNLTQLEIGDKLNIGTQVILEISKIGKECHKYCAIYYKLGDCIMPREGIFARVLKGGEVTVGDDIGVIKNAK
ncbi:MAG: MOSC domain-containing protein [Candidatus Omnitrophica bacterium]|nr:MOSC domain-containing protein [Candidatus Omnitrophota bacterium]